MNNFVRKLLTEWRKMKLPFAGGRIILAVSGGADSTALTLAFADLVRRKKICSEIFIAHFNHKLRGEEGDKDAEFTAQLAKKCDFAFIVESGKVSAEGNLEQNARTARYRFLLDAAREKKAELVAAAHTLDDQAETFLMRLMRGSGLKGLGAMRKDIVLRGVLESFESEFEFSPETENNVARRDSEGEFETDENESLTSVRLIRPFLEWARRSDTENFCAQNDVEPRRDAMNDNEDFLRVAVRRRLLPLINELAPNAGERIAATAFRLQTEAEALEFLLPCAPSENETFVALKDLRQLAPPVRLLYLRKWIEKNIGTRRGISAKHLKAVENLAFSLKSGSTAELPNGWRVRRQVGKLHIFANKV